MDYDEIHTEPNENLLTEDGEPVPMVAGNEAFFGPLRTIVNEALRPYGIAMRFLWRRPEDGYDPEHPTNPVYDNRWSVVSQPYAFFVRRDDSDDATDAALAAKRGKTSASAWEQDMSLGLTDRSIKSWTVDDASEEDEE